MSAALQNAHHLKVRIGQSEFEASGDEETVNSQYALFLELIKDPWAAAAAPKGVHGEPDNKPSVAPLDGVWARFYSREGERDVSLKLLPSTDHQIADGLILLLYGYAQLCDTDTVGSAELLAMAKKSGLRIDRVDRNIQNGHLRYIIRGGARRGCRYSLNNQGKAYAQELLETQLER